MSVVRFGVSLPRELVKAFDQRIRAKGYGTRSEAIRDVMRRYLVEEEWGEHSGEVVGTITVVYDHATRELPRTLTDLQHQFHGSIYCSTHVHLDQHNCLEVVVLRGSGPEVQAVADRLISTRGVKHGRLVCTTTGRDLA